MKRGRLHVAKSTSCLDLTENTRTQSGSKLSIKRWPCINTYSAFLSNLLENQLQSILSAYHPESLWTLYKSVKRQNKILHVIMQTHSPALIHTIMLVKVSIRGHGWGEILKTRLIQCILNKVKIRTNSHWLQFPVGEVGRGCNEQKIDVFSDWNRKC